MSCPVNMLLRKFAACSSSEGVKQRSEGKIRLCTSPSLVTRMARMRLQDRGSSSIWRKALRSCRGTITTPAMCVIPESNCEALSIRVAGSRCLSRPWRMDSMSCSGSGLTVSRLSMKSR